MTLKEMRKESGLKAEKVASVLGISRMQLYNLENGICKIDKLKVSYFCNIYKKTKDEIYEAIRLSGGEVVKD